MTLKWNVHEVDLINTKPGAVAQWSKFENSPHHPEVEGLSPPSTAGTGTANHYSPLRILKQQLFLSILK
jgi:hypothetical protein